MTTYHSESTAVTPHADDALDVGDLLPGLRWLVRHIFDWHTNTSCKDC